ncbi:MAG: hypothetical protein R3F04_10155 [Lysobacteraceae bacterium]
MTPPSPLPCIELEWVDDQHRYGVHTREGVLLWWMQPRAQSAELQEAAHAQTLADFRARGAPNSVPPGILASLRRQLGVPPPADGTP